MNILDEINALIKKYAPRPYFTSQEHLEDIIQNESLAEVRSDFVMDEWVIGHITEIIEKHQEPKTQKEINEVLDEIISESTTLKISYTDHDKDTYRRGVNDVIKLIDKYRGK